MFSILSVNLATSMTDSTKQDQRSIDAIVDLLIRLQLTLLTLLAIKTMIPFHDFLSYLLFNGHSRLQMVLWLTDTHALLLEILSHLKMRAMNYL